MSSRVLFVDDDLDIRAVVELALGLDPDFTVKTCADGNEALAISAKWDPAIILCDVMMPGLDGPTMLARLRDDTKMSNIPVVFMTARAQPDEIARLKSCGAAAVLTKPFDPMSLAAKVREQLRSSERDAFRAYFIDRLRTDAATLRECRNSDCSDSSPSFLTECFQSCVHKLAGAAGVYDFQAVSAEAAALESAIIEARKGQGDPQTAEVGLQKLLDCIEREASAAPSERQS